MRKSVNIAMIILAVLTVVTGMTILTSVNGGGAGSPGLHITVSRVFITVSFVQGWLNRKPIKNYFAGLGWKWAFFALPLVTVTAFPFIVFQLWR